MPNQTDTNLTPMSIGVFEMGPVPDEVADQFPNYASMIIHWLSTALPNIDWQPVSPIRGDVVPDVAQFDGFIYSGSRHGVYDVIDWIPAMEHLIRDAAAAGKPQFGICFGHQLMAQALGGRSEKSNRGWGCGIQQYDTNDESLRAIINHSFGRHSNEDKSKPTQHDQSAQQLSILVMHQDQVVKLPPNSQAIGGNEFCPLGMIEYESIPALSVQFHPEFSNAYVAELLRIRGGVVIDQPIADDACLTLTQASDNHQVAAWAAAFFKQHL